MQRHSGDRYVSPRFFGQHMMFESSLKPAIPVHAIRLWDSSTEWCQMDRGTRPNRYDFRQLDKLLAQASRLNADVEFAFGGTPRWAASGSYPQVSAAEQCSSDSGAAAPAKESFWEDFVAAMVRHAKGRIRAYELWNEADQPYYWTGGVEAMVRMSVDAASIIHRVDPSALVLSPSVTGTPGGAAFLSHYLSRLPTGTIDAVALHSYTDGAWPELVVPPEVSAVRSALPPAYAHIPIWSTEGGWGLNARFSATPSNQRAFVARYDLQMLVQGMVRSYWYAYPNTQWGTLWNGKALTPAGIATATVSAWLSGARLAGCTTDNNLWSCTVSTDTGEPARIVWVTATPISGYATSGYTMVNTLDGRRSPVHAGSITVTTEPVLLSR